LVSATLARNRSNWGVGGKDVRSKGVQEHHNIFSCEHLSVPPKRIFNHPAAHCAPYEEEVHNSNGAQQRKPNNQQQQKNNAKSRANHH
jgi:hypothetical protein